MFYTCVQKIFSSKDIIFDCGNLIFFHHRNMLVGGTVKNYVTAGFIDNVINIFPVAHVPDDWNHCCFFANSFYYDRSYSGFHVQALLWQSQRKVILSLAEKGGCVIVGRCADYILRDRFDLLKVFVYASLEKRTERIAKVYGDTEDAPLKRLEEKDKRRRAYYRLYTDMEWGQVKNYDIALNSGEIGIEKCVEILTALY